MAQEVLISISLIIGVAAVLTIIAKAIKQPPIISYLITGILVGPLFLGLIGPSAPSSDFIYLFARIGVALLLFIVGLSLDYRVFKDVGAVSSIAGIGQIIITAVIGFLIAIGLGFNQISAIYLGAALAFSSTVIVVKIFSDKKEIDTLHARIALGILIVQDFIAAVALLIAPTLQHTDFSVVLISFAKVVLLIILLFGFTSLVLKRMMHYFARSQEVLFLFGIAWALVLATLFDYFGFSLEIGALIAGMSLASTKYSLEIGGKIKPLRDFFIVLFFVFFGSQLAVSISSGLLYKALIFSGFVLIGKPLFIMGFMRLFGYRKRTNFLTGSSLAQISEFSLIIVLLGFTLGHLSKEIMSLVILISLITIGISTYWTYHSGAVFQRLSGVLKLFEGNKKFGRETNKKFYDIVLFGYNRTGYDILKTLKELKVKFIVVDYNPKVIMDLSKKRVNCVYGDADDKEFIDELNLYKTKLVISTIPEVESNLVIKKRLEEMGSDAVFIATAEQIQEALDLYKEGVDYVIIPHLLGGKHASEMIKSNKINLNKYRKKGKEHIADLKRRA